MVRWKQQDDKRGRKALGEIGVLESGDRRYSRLLLRLCASTNSLTHSVSVARSCHHPPSVRLPSDTPPPPPSPPSSSTLSSTSFLTRLTFRWIDQLFTFGRERGFLELEDSIPLTGHDDTSNLSSQFHTLWSHELTECITFNRQSRWKSWRSHTQPQVRRPSLFQCLWKICGWRYTFLGLLKLLTDCIMFTGPVLLGYLVEFIDSYNNNNDSSSSSEEPSWHGWVYAGGLIAGVLINAILSTQYNFAIRRVGLYLRAIIVSAVHRKTLTISNTARANFSNGQIQNIMSVDTDRITDIAISIHEFWSLPIQIGLALYLLYREVSWSLLAGLSIVLLLIPFNAFLTKQINNVTIRMMVFKDIRLSLLDELIRHIRTIKMMSLERIFHKRVMSARNLEVQQLGRRKYLDAICVYLWATTPILVSLSTFATYSWLMDRPLSSSKVFASLSLFNILIRPLNAFPWVVNGLVEGRVSLVRVYNFLSSPDISTDQLDLVDALDTSDEFFDSSEGWTTKDHPHRIREEDGSRIDNKDGREITKQEHTPGTCVACLEGSWRFLGTNVRNETDTKKTNDEDKSSQPSSSSSPALVSSPSSPAVLRQVHLHILRGSFIGVVGSVGSGKSALLLGLLGELTPARITGASNVCTRTIESKRVAYVSQETWIPSACTLREVILFHSPYDPILYEATIRACALEEDISRFEHGDATQIDEGGTNLSGGQRMRLSLARAIYARADLILLDDPLSCVDTIVAKHLIRHVFSSETGMLKHATRIMVTHQVESIRREVDRMWTMENGRIVTEVIQTRQQQEEVNNTQQEESKESKEEEDQTMPHANHNATTENPSMQPTASLVVASPSPAGPDVDEPAPFLKGFLTSSESRARGSIRSRVLRAYFSWVGLCLCGIVLLSMFLMQGSKNATDAWLGLWVQHVQETEEDSNQQQSTSDARYYLRILAYLSAGNSAAALFRSFIFAYAGLEGARRSFRNLLKAILGAPISWFDSNPSGRILNRFSNDTYSIDEAIPFQGNIFLAQLFMFVGSIAVIASVVPAILILLPILGLIYYRIQSSYRSISRELRRLDSISRSPIFTHFSETLSGSSVVRAFKLEDRFQTQLEMKLDTNQRIQFMNLGSSNWLNIRLQCIGVIMVGVVAILGVVTCVYPLHGASGLHFLLNTKLIGLAIAYALPLTDNMNGVISSFTDTEKEIIAVERTVEYIQVKPEEEEEQPSEATQHEESVEDEDEDLNQQEDEENQTMRRTKTKTTTRKKKANMRINTVSDTLISMALLFFALVFFFSQTRWFNTHVRNLRQKCRRLHFKIPAATLPLSAVCRLCTGVQ